VGAQVPASASFREREKGITQDQWLLRSLSTRSSSRRNWVAQVAIERAEAGDYYRYVAAETHVRHIVSGYICLELL
jgi:hypothetical protein